MAQIVSTWFIVLLALSSVTRSSSFVGIASSVKIGISRRHLLKLSSKGNECGVIYQYSTSSLDHLKGLDDDSTSGKESKDPEEWSKEKVTAIMGAMISIGVCFVIGEILSSKFMGSSDTGFGPLTGALGGVAGWKLLGGDAIRAADLPKDGGYDAKFVYDKPSRLISILDRVRQSDGGSLVQSSKRRDLSTALRLISEVHSEQYLEEFKAAVEDANVSDRIRRLNPIVMRTLIDKYSFDAAVNSVADWIDAVDGAMDSTARPVFALTRPPSHHACQSRGMGGCMLCGPAIAANFALENGASNVAILDIDAHHGNGIAHCVQGESRIRYCSIHEAVPEKNWFKKNGSDPLDEEGPNPRKPDASDTGPMGNILNVPLDKNTAWDTGYREALEDSAIPWLSANNPDVLIVASGFDALAADITSSLKLQPADYAKIGHAIHEQFGGRVAFGLEGGYCWQGGELSEAVVQLTKPWSGNDT